ncbi:hypothetical protein WR25_18782 isoform A [Diploscapter pachys]|uniref:Arrestin C-terminal-like domain-containing protein n=1 Tax=Diploscapter pachys TaxID=2018661 RepID=A0A2A2JQV5_9BILA|nr:hypothetical protein WR25_18782 isoform A [Diploscapter pachys]
MQPTINIDISLDKPVYNDEEKIQGRVSIEARPTCEIDSVEARLYGIADAHFTTDGRQFVNKRVIIDELSEIWRNCSLEELLSLDSAGPSSQKLSVTQLTLPFTILLPPNLPPSFYEPLSLVTVRYSIEIRILKNNTCICVQHLPFAIQPPAPLERPSIKQADSIHSREFKYPKDRSIVVECRLRKNQFTPTERIDARIGVYNRWKASLRYVHLSIVKCIQIEGQDCTGKSEKKLVTVQTTGVGLPFEKKKVSVRESYSFEPQFNIPALCPSMSIPGLVRCDYLLKVDVGTSHTCILATLTIPITIVSESSTPTIQDDLVSLLDMPSSTPSSPNSSEASYSASPPPPTDFITQSNNPNLRATAVIDLLA